MVAASLRRISVDMGRMLHQLRRHLYVICNINAYQDIYIFATEPLSKQPTESLSDRCSRNIDQFDSFTREIVRMKQKHLYGDCSTEFNVCRTIYLSFVVGVHVPSGVCIHKSAFEIRKQRHQTVNTHTTLRMQLLNERRDSINGLRFSRESRTRL
jgi:hypothetical protein